MNKFKQFSFAIILSIFAFTSLAFASIGGGGVEQPMWKLDGTGSLEPVSSSWGVTMPVGGISEGDFNLNNNDILNADQTETNSLIVDGGHDDIYYSWSRALTTLKQDQSDWAQVMLNKRNEDHWMSTWVSEDGQVSWHAWNQPEAIFVLNNSGGVKINPFDSGILEVKSAMETEGVATFKDDIILDTDAEILGVGGIVTIGSSPVLKNDVIMVFGEGFNAGLLWDDKFQTNPTTYLALDSTTKTMLLSGISEYSTDFNIPNASTNTLRIQGDSTLANHTLITHNGTDTVISSGAGNIKLDDNIEITGGVINGVTTVNTATYTVLSSDYFLDVTYTATGAITITIPSALILTEFTLHIKDGGFNSGTNNITVTTQGTETIDGSTDDYVIAENKASMSIKSNGTNLLIF